VVASNSVTSSAGNATGTTSTSPDAGLTSGSTPGLVSAQPGDGQLGNKLADAYTSPVLEITHPDLGSHSVVSNTPVVTTSSVTSFAADATATTSTSANGGLTSGSSPGLFYAQLGNGQFGYRSADAYTGPVLGIVYQELGSSSADIIYGTNQADFINSGAGDDAIDGGAGNDVIDGGLGSNFITGGAGSDTFFLDGRAAASSITWSTITDFQAGDHLTIWGYQPGVSQFRWAASDGAANYKGATLYCDLDGNGSIDTSVTFSGLTQAQLPTPSYGSVAGNDYIMFG